MTRVRERLRALATLHGKLAKRYKQYEVAFQKLPINLGNEYRYLARSTVDMLRLLSDLESGVDAAESSSAFEDALSRAELSVRQAYHDLIDGALYDLLVLLDEMSKSASPRVIEALNEYPKELTDFVDAAHVMVAESRADLTRRDELYDQLYDEFWEDILEHRQRLRGTILPKVMVAVAEDEDELQQLTVRVDQELRQSEARFRRSMQAAVWGIVIGIAGIVVTLILTLFL